MREKSLKWFRFHHQMCESQVWLSPLATVGDDEQSNFFFFRRTKVRRKIKSRWNDLSDFVFQTRTKQQTYIRAERTNYDWNLLERKLGEHSWEKTEKFDALCLGKGGFFPRWGWCCLSCGRLRRFFLSFLLAKFSVMLWRFWIKLPLLLNFENHQRRDCLSLNLQVI